LVSPWTNRKSGPLAILARLAISSVESGQPHLAEHSLDLLRGHRHVVIALLPLVVIAEWLPACASTSAQIVAPLASARKPRRS